MTNKQKLILLLLFTQLNFANGADFDVKRILGKWEVTNVKDKKKDVVEIKKEKDSIILYHEDEYGNSNRLLSFPNKPFKIGPKKVTYQKEHISIWEPDTLDVTDELNFWDFNGKTGKMLIFISNILRNVTPENSYKMNFPKTELTMKRVR